VSGAGLCVWLTPGYGLRIEQALAVCKEDFIENGAVLRVAWQASGDGKTREPLRHRTAGEYRDVPVPSWLREMTEDMPNGPLIPGNGELFSVTGRSISGSGVLPRSQASRTGSRRTHYGTPSPPVSKGAELHRMQHSVAGVRTVQQGPQIRYRRGYRRAGTRKSRSGKRTRARLQQVTRCVIQFCCTVRQLDAVRATSKRQRRGQGAASRRPASSGIRHGW
jgi:hypothetical protein